MEDIYLIKKYEYRNGIHWSKVNNIVADCNLQLNGLEAGTYYLVETKAPDGYNKVSGPIKVMINQSTDENEANWTLTAQGANGQV